MAARQELHQTGRVKASIDAICRSFLTVLQRMIMMGFVEYCKEAYRRGEEKWLSSIAREILSERVGPQEEFTSSSFTPEYIEYLEKKHKISWSSDSVEKIGRQSCVVVLIYPFLSALLERIELHLETCVAEYAQCLQDCFAFEKKAASGGRNTRGPKTLAGLIEKRSKTVASLRRKYHQELLPKWLGTIVNDLFTESFYRNATDIHKHVIRSYYTSVCDRLRARVHGALPKMLNLDIGKIFVEPSLAEFEEFMDSIPSSWEAFYAAVKNVVDGLCRC